MERYMEGVVAPQVPKQMPLSPARKHLASGSQKDLWLVVREGSLTDLDLALAMLKKNGGNINSRNIFGLTPLHIATWRNHIPVVKRLLEAGADPDARDGESGWSSLHRALHFGHLAVASVLLQAGALLTLEDSKSRTPVDLLSSPLLQCIGSGRDSVSTEVFSWGSGVNYQLGTGNAHLQRLPCKVDSLHGSLIKSVSASKFHSVAVSASGEVYTWGFGRGGRLGHPDFDIHSGQAAVITPRLVTSGLGSYRVRAVAAAKHHTVIATESGDVFTWGSNREGQLGYTSVDTQPTPRRVSSLRAKVISVAAANKHTAVVSGSGEVFTWGCNKEGQLGYGTSNSASNYTPRTVEYLKGKNFIGVSAAKYHTVLLGADGEVYTWGHRLVTPRRVIIARNVRKGGATPLKFYRKERLRVVAIAAGMVHSMALTDDGALFYWISSDPDLKCQQLYSLCGKSIVNISAGKYWTAAVTNTGDVYMSDGKKCRNEPPIPTRLHGIKKATSVSVGETHILLLGSLYHPPYSHMMSQKNIQKTNSSLKDELLEELSEDFVFDNEMGAGRIIESTGKDDVGSKCAPSLKTLCEKTAAEYLVEPRNALQLLEIAESLGADNLKKHCEEIVIRNLDYVFTVSANSIASASLDILANLEKLLDLKSSEPWSHRRLPTPTATFPVIINSEEEDNETDISRTRDNQIKKKYYKPKNESGHRLDGILQFHDDPNQGISKQVRALRKKLQQIEVLEAKRSSGHILDNQQIAKLQMRLALESSLAELGVGDESTQSEGCSSSLSDGNASKKAEVSRKQRRKSKQKAAQVEASEMGPMPLKGFDVETSQVPKMKEGDAMFDGTEANQDIVEESHFCNKKKEIFDSPKNKFPSQTASKKKSKKGGLSMFLSGALDNNFKDITPPPPPPPPKIDGPAWGGAKIAKGPTSLREIQNEQRKTDGTCSSLNKDHGEESFDGNRDGGKILLSSFLSSKPIPVAPARPSQVADGERSTPPWVASGTPPLQSRPSLRDIQMQQQGKQQQSLSNSPKTRTAGFSVATGQGSPSDGCCPNRWFKQEVDSPSSIRSIQIEERAMKDLKRFYTSVKVVKNQS